MQVAVKHKDCPYLRFLWMQPGSTTVDMYEYRRHIFGARDSPACANFALQQVAKDYIDEFPQVSPIVEKNFYMDDLVSSFEDTETAKYTAIAIKEVLRRGKFNLTKWCSNSQEFCKHFDEATLAKPLHILLSDECFQRVIGSTLESQK